MGRLVKNSDKGSSAASKKKKDEPELEVEDEGSDGDYESCDEDGNEEEEVKNDDSKKASEKNVSLYDLLDVPKDTSIEDIV